MNNILPWFQVAGEAIKVERQIFSDSTTEITHEVQDFGIKLELKDTIEGNGKPGWKADLTEPQEWVGQV